MLPFRPHPLHRFSPIYVLGVKCGKSRCFVIQMFCFQVFYFLGVFFFSPKLYNLINGRQTAAFNPSFQGWKIFLPCMACTASLPPSYHRKGREGAELGRKHWIYLGQGTPGTFKHSIFAPHILATFTWPFNLGFNLGLHSRICPT